MGKWITAWNASSKQLALFIGFIADVMPSIPHVGALVAVSPELRSRLFLRAFNGLNSVICPAIRHEQCCCSIRNRPSAVAGPGASMHGVRVAVVC
jgi:hypothetical protein